ncbi:MAG: peptidase MA family metallohydrolase [Chloroflexota bacterium]
MGEVMGPRRIPAILVAVATSVLLLGAVPLAAPVAAGTSPATFGRPTAKSTFGTGIVFSQPVSIDRRNARIELLLTIADAIGPDVVEVPSSPAAGAQTLTYTLDTSGSAHMIPNTPIVARWRVIAADDPTAVGLGPELMLVYADDRFQWQTASSALVRVHWYKGDAAFGAKALKLGEDEVRATSTLLGVTETRPVDFFVYADVTSFYGAIGPGAHENVAGSAYADIRTLLGLIPPDQINDSLVAVRIPHEFVHLVFDTASKNPYHSPPRWLNEGLAVYQSEGYGSSDRGQVDQAANDGTLIPLDGLSGQFPNGNDFFLAYAESAASVDFMIRTYGPEALASLIRSYARGRTDDEAFSAALGLDTTAFSNAWFKDAKAKPKPKFGPQPAAPGPVPSAWLGAVPGSVASGAPGSTARSAGASAAAGPSAAPGSVGDRASSGGPGGLLAVVAIAAVVAVLAVMVVTRRRRPADGSR